MPFAPKVMFLAVCPEGAAGALVFRCLGIGLQFEKQARPERALRRFVVSPVRGVRI